jgi:hypothetical protein
MQAGYVHPENQGAFQSGALRSIDISTLDRQVRQAASPSNLPASGRANRDQPNGSD